MAKKLWGESSTGTQPTGEIRWSWALVTFTSICGVCLLCSPVFGMTGMTRSQRVMTQLLFTNIWPDGSPEACLVAQLQQGLSYHEAIDACAIDLSGAGLGAELPQGLGAFPVLVPTGSRTPHTAACVSVPAGGGFGPPAEEAEADKEKKPTKEELEKERALALKVAEDLLKRAEASGAEGYAAGYQRAMTEVFLLDRQLQREYNVPMPKYPYRRTVQGAESACQQVNAFIAQCEASQWRSSECQAMFDAINHCANSELVRLDGDERCQPVAPDSATVVAILELECSKLARGADGQDPCSRQPPDGADPAQIILERCGPPKDGLETPDVPGDKPGCPKADLEKFLSLALPAKDYSFITSKVGGPPPPPPRGEPNPTGTPGSGAPYPGIVRR